MTSSVCPGSLMFVLRLVLLPACCGDDLLRVAQSSPLIPHSSVANPYLFQGARYDPETGFYYSRNRMYNPRTGRFLQRDPVWDEQNVGGWYTFTGNSPLSRRDPLGLDGETVIERAVGKLNRALLRYRALSEQSGVPPAELKTAKQELMRARIDLQRKRALRRLRESEERQERIQQGLPPGPELPLGPCPEGTRTIEELEKQLDELIEELKRQYVNNPRINEVDALQKRVHLLRNRLELLVEQTKQAMTSDAPDSHRSGSPDAGTDAPQPRPADRNSNPVPVYPK